jgi:nickel-dependent lactate racemase
MNIWLAYGKKGKQIELNDAYNIRIVEPEFVDALADPVAALREALQSPIGEQPLKDFVKPDNKVGIIFSDITRPTPNSTIIPAILNELGELSPENIILFNSLGTHRENTEDELRMMIGDEIYDKYRIIQNNAFDRKTQVNLGQTRRGQHIWLNRELLQCDVKILTGFIEPHFFAGFSGGGKAIMPGMAGQETVLANHDAQMINDPKSVWGVMEGNPIQEEILEVTENIPGKYLLNVTLNRNKEITGVFAGDMRKAHLSGCEFVKTYAMIPVSEPFDIVITTNSGFPLDLNLYQAIKGVSAAAQVVKDGGCIIVAADCWDGIPEHGLYGKLLSEARGPQELLDTIMKTSQSRQDQWQAQIQAKIQLRSDIYVYSENLSDKQIRNALLKPCRNIEKTISELLDKFGQDASICVLPEGPQTVPYIK